MDSVQISFGLKIEHKEAIILEPFFLLGHYFGGLTWNEYYHWPVKYKQWLLRRLEEENRRTIEAQKGNNISDLRNQDNPVVKQALSTNSSFPANVKKFTR